MTQNRQPEGIPSGGQYAATAHSDVVQPLQRPVNKISFDHGDQPFDLEPDGDGRYPIYATDEGGAEIGSFTFDGDPADRAALEAAAVAILTEQRKRLVAVTTPGARVLWADPDGEEVHPGTVVTAKGEIITVALDSGGEAEVFGNELVPGWPAYPELDGYDIPAPLEGQKFLDGTPITAGTFEAAYDQFFRPLEEFEASHGQWQTTRAPSEEALLELAGADKSKLGKVVGVYLEADEETGEPLVEVHTSNGQYCYRNDCDGTCHACLEEDIHTLPGFVRTTNDEGDISHFFRPVDPVPAQRHLADKKTREMLNHRLYAREAITSGAQPPWAVLSLVRSGADRRRLAEGLAAAKRRALRWRDDLSYADAVTAALDAGSPIPSARIRQPRPNGQIGYEIGEESLARNTAAAVEARAAAKALHAELEQGLPPGATALVAAEHTRLEKVAVKAGEQVERSRTEIAKGEALMRAWASRLHIQAAPDLTAVATFETEIRAFDWSSSWPGDPADCPPTPPVNGG